LDNINTGRQLHSQALWRALLSIANPDNFHCAVGGFYAVTPLQLYFLRHFLVRVVVPFIARFKGVAKKGNTIKGIGI
jgi:hypothetical protein